MGLEFVKFERGKGWRSSLPDPFERRVPPVVNARDTFKCGVHWKARTYFAGIVCVCIFRESGGALLMERIVLLCTGDERITVPCPPFRATPGQYRAVVNQASFLDEPHSNSWRFMLAEHAFRFTACRSSDTSLDAILETR